MKRLIFIVILVLTVSTLLAKTIWQDRNFYGSNAGLRVGDIVMISVKDTSNLNFSLAFNNDNSYSVSSNPDQTVTKFLPKISSDRNSTTAAKNGFQSKGSVDFKIAATITRRAGRNYVINGTRNYIFQGLRNRIRVTGIVNPGLIQGNLINSSSIANFTLEISGTRQGVINLNRPALKKDETANVTLTEKEKQKIIIDYLQKMLREILQ